jgi:SAM-dependent methyltransferase
MSEIIKNQVSDYYSKKISEHGATPQGVDWNGELSQNLRFIQLMKVCEDNDGIFTLLDYGCGYGGMLDYLLPIYKNRMLYKGLDISTEMINAAKLKHDAKNEFFETLPASFKADYVVASGIFNVRQDTTDEEWLKYIYQTLDEINNISLKGFSFNILTSYSDAEYMRNYLYYANPETIFSYCKKKYSLRVALLHDYPLYEFTIIVKK